MSSPHLLHVGSPGQCPGDSCCAPQPPQMSLSTPTASCYSPPGLGLRHHVLSIEWRSSVCCWAHKPTFLSPVPFTGPIAPSVPFLNPAGRCSVGLWHLPLHLWLLVGLPLLTQHLSISVLHFILDSSEGKWHVTKGPSHESPAFNSFLPCRQWFGLWIQECPKCQCFLGRWHPIVTSWPR